MKILLLCQFSGITPYWLSNNPLSFDQLCAEAQIAANASTNWGFVPPQVLIVEESWEPPMATTALREGENGKAEVWRYKWDSSG